MKKLKLFFTLNSKVGLLVISSIFVSGLGIYGVMFGESFRGDKVLAETYSTVVYPTSSGRLPWNRSNGRMTGWTDYKASSVNKNYVCNEKYCWVYDASQAKWENSGNARDLSVIWSGQIKATNGDTCTTSYSGTGICPWSNNGPRAAWSDYANKRYAVCTIYYDPNNAGANDTYCWLYDMNGRAWLNSGNPYSLKSLWSGQVKATNGNTCTSSYTGPGTCPWNFDGVSVAWTDTVVKTNTVCNRKWCWVYNYETSQWQNSGSPYDLSSVWVGAYATHAAANGDYPWSHNGPFSAWEDVTNNTIAICNKRYCWIYNSNSQTWNNGGNPVNVAVLWSPAITTKIGVGFPQNNPDYKPLYFPMVNSLPHSSDFWYTWGYFGARSSYSPDVWQWGDAGAYLPMVWGTVNTNQLAEIRSKASQHPGSKWLIFNEPDVADETNLSPAAAVPVYNEIYDALKGADSTAKIYCCGTAFANTQWLEDFRNQIVSGNDKKVFDLRPLDGIHFHGYPCSLSVSQDCVDTYDAFDNRFDVQLTMSKIESYLNYLKSKTEFNNKPVIISEIGVVSDVESEDSGGNENNAYNVVLNNFMNPFLNWLDTDIDPYLWDDVTHMFWFSTHFHFPDTGHRSASNLIKQSDHTTKSVLGTRWEQEAAERN